MLGLYYSCKLLPYQSMYSSFVSRYFKDDVVKCRNWTITLFSLSLSLSLSLSPKQGPPIAPSNGYNNYSMILVSCVNNVIVAFGFFNWSKFNVKIWKKTFTSSTQIWEFSIDHLTIVWEYPNVYLQVQFFNCKPWFHQQHV